MLHQINSRLCLPAFAILALLLPTVAYAQAQPGMPNLEGQPGQKQEKATIDGKLTAAQGKFIKVDSKGKEWILRVDAKPEEVIVRGEAEKGWVQPGMFVTFDATLDRKGMGQEPVSEVRVFTPTPAIQLGVTEAGALPGFGSEGSDGAAEASEEEIGQFTVVGRLTGVNREGKWNVTAGRARATVEVAEDAKIHVELPNPALIRIGDTVKGTAWYYNQGAGILKGQVEVEAAEPFAAPEEKKRTRRGRDRDDAKQEDAVDPAEAKSIFDKE